MVGARRWGAGAGLALAMIVGASGIGGAQSLPDLDLSQSPTELCSVVFSPGAFQGFLPEGEVAAGEPISITVEWQKSNVAADKVDLLGCVSVDGQPAEDLATLGRKVDNDGEHHLSFLLPSDLLLGAKVCERSAVIGPKADITRTPATCYAVASAQEEVAAPAPREAAAPASPPAVVPAEPKAAPADTKETVAGPAAPEVAGATEEREPAAAAAPSALARTGSGSRPLGALAGLTIILGGLAVALSRPRVAAVRAVRRSPQD